MSAVPFVIVALVFASYLWRRIRSPRPDYPPLALAADDPLMLQAFASAKASLAQFRDLLAKPHSSAAVKFPLVTSSATTEHVWAEVLEVQGNQVKVRLTSPPVSHEGPLDRLYTKSLDDLEDWQVTLPNGNFAGGFTMRAMFVRGREQWGELPAELEALERRYGAA